MWPCGADRSGAASRLAEFASAVIADVYGFYMAPDQASFERKRSDLAGRFASPEQHLRDGGPYFNGERFGLVDAAFAPIFRLLDTFDQVADFGLLHGLPRTTAYHYLFADGDVRYEGALSSGVLRAVALTGAVSLALWAILRVL